MAGIYIHVPFCASFCTYCDFYSITQLSRKGKYLEALMAEMQQWANFFNGVPPTTLYFGGGTPSLLSISELEQVLSTVQRIYLAPYGRTLADLEEVTLEVNPDDVTLEKALAWRRCGISRVSMGVQSFQDRTLKWMGRRHDARQAQAAYGFLRQAGFGNISLDLIFGYCLDTVNDLHSSQERRRLWGEDLEKMVGLNPEHISSYQLSIEPGSTLERWVRSGKAVELDAETAAEEYALLQSVLSRSGYHQYEISNFARPGYESRHNRSYWKRVPYLGLGPAAHSFDGKIRFWNPADLTAYVAGKGAGQEVLTREDVFNEQWMLGLRQSDGLALSDLDQELLGRVAADLDRLLSEGLLVKSSTGQIKIPSEKLFVSDGIICELMLD